MQGCACARSITYGAAPEGLRARKAAGKRSQQPRGTVCSSRTEVRGWGTNSWHPPPPPDGVLSAPSLRLCHPVPSSDLPSVCFCLLQKPDGPEPAAHFTRRDALLRSSSLGGLLALGAILDLGGLDSRPTRNLGVRSYGSVRSLNLCPPKPNCISTAEVRTRWRDEPAYFRQSLCASVPPPHPVLSCDGLLPAYPFKGCTIPESWTPLPVLAARRRPTTPTTLSPPGTTTARGRAGWWAWTRRRRCASWWTWWARPAPTASRPAS